MFKGALEKRAEDKMLRGANSGDMYVFLCEVQRLHLIKGRVIHFKWLKQCGVVNGLAMNNFNVIGGLDRVLNRCGMYLMFRQSKRASDKYKAFLKVLSRVKDDDEKLKRWGKIANGSKPMDHAIGLRVTNGGGSRLVDNGIIGGSKEYSLYNIADRMCDVKMCFAVDMWEE